MANDTFLIIQNFSLLPPKKCKKKVITIKENRIFFKINTKTIQKDNTHATLFHHL